MSASNTTIRHQMIQQREALSIASRQQAEAFVAAQLLADAVYQACQSIGVYIAHRGECDPVVCVQQAWEDGKSCYLPVVQADGRMQWARYAPDTELQNNRYGIPEPVSQDWIGVRELDLVLVPMVAFNDQRQRLGYGGGYFDRCFAFRASSPEPYLLGIAYAWQHSNNWQSHPGDLVLDRIITV